jgi:maleylpyruvate isomerase
MTHPLDTDLTETRHMVAEASDRYLATVAVLEEDTFGLPSVLPGWSVAHTIAHIASNATGISRAVRAAMAGEDPPWVYETNDSRDAEIDERAAWPVNRLRELNGASVSELQDVIGRCPDGILDVLLPRVIDGPSWSVRDWIGARWREVEIHHTDLGVGYTREQWTDEFVDYLTRVAVFDRESELALTLRSPEGDVEIAGGGPVISGSRRDLLWWLIGRGEGEGVSGNPPRLGPWQRRIRA